MMSLARFYRVAGARPFSTAYSVSTVGVIGLGLMGHGIAQAAAEKGYKVVAVELEERFLQGGLKRIGDSVKKITSKAVEKGKMDKAAGDAHVASTMARITNEGLDVIKRARYRYMYRYMYRSARTVLYGTRYYCLLCGLRGGKSKN